MSRYINSFQNITAFMTAISSSALSEPYVAYNENAKKLYFNVDYTKEYLTIVSTSDNNIIGWKVGANFAGKTISVSTDNGSTWTNKKANTSGTTLATLNTGDKLLIKGSNTGYGATSNSNYFTSTGQFNIEGNIMSLIYGDNFVGQTTLSTNYTFNILFSETKVVDVSNLILPATTLTNYCYQNMFNGCTSLTTAPELPATTLIDRCYYRMFYGCNALTTAPTLPATTLSEGCYSDMFRNCTSLIKAPELPATILTDNCYNGMFNGCTALNYIKCLATNISATTCTNVWVVDVPASGTFVKDANMTSWTTGVSGIPSGWTVQDV